jgi:hypothetical protein
MFYVYPCGMNASNQSATDRQRLQFGLTRAAVRDLAER